MLGNGTCPSLARMVRGAVFFLLVAAYAFTPGTDGAGLSLERGLEKARTFLVQGAAQEGHDFMLALREKYPHDPTLRYFLGLACERLGRAMEAQRHLTEVTAMAPKFAPAHSALGGVAMTIGSFSASVSHYTTAIELEPKSTTYRYNRGLARFNQRDLNGAAADYREALALDPRHEGASNNLGVTLMTMEDFEGAIAAYEQAAAAHGGTPDPRTLFNMILCKHRIASDWANYVANQKLLVRAAGRHGGPSRDGDGASGTPVTPFNCLEFSVFSPVDCASVGASFVRDAVAPLAEMRSGGAAASAFDLASIPRPRRRKAGTDGSAARKKRRLRVAYVHSSGFVGSTTTARLLAAVIASHDARSIRVDCVALRNGDGSAARLFIEETCGHFWNAPPDQVEAARALRDRAVHIAIDITGLTIGPISQLLYLRPAPIQVSFHAYPGPAGQDEVDYLVTDRDTAPPQYHRHLYREKFVVMPHSYFATSYATLHPEVLDGGNLPSREDVGLPADAAFVYCSFNQFYKVTPNLFASWMRVLGDVPGSVLWLMSFAEGAVPHLRAEARSAGIDPERLVFAPKFPRATEYLSKAHCQLFLDAPLFNAHSTMTDVLWSGIPAITTPGGAGFAMRVASGILRAAGLQDLVVPDLAAYEALAVRVGSNSTLSAELKARIRANRATYPLFDSARFAENLDAAFHMMWDVRAATKGKTMHIIVTDDRPVARDHISLQPILPEKLKGKR